MSKFCAGKKLKGILENPLYNDLPMSNVEARNTTDQDPGYHELQGIGKEIMGVAYLPRMGPLDTEVPGESACTSPKHPHALSRRK